MTTNGNTPGGEPTNRVPSQDGAKPAWVTPRLRKQSVYSTTNMMMAGATDGTSLS